ncbi:triose-phosphate isomerase [Flaviaesturariibacter amylovorans]|uniref:Triosephosphate isomerase n=1 Tax=Flaviaesturariibacter amylovorans TaxID=1084520 RepID=A0ABP8GS07_9BACT
MRKQIAAANWKMNLTYQQAERLLDEILQEKIALGPDQQVLFAVPFPYLVLAKSEVDEVHGYAIAAQNAYSKVNGAYTGEVSVEMLQSIGIKYCILGHSERREYFNESNEQLARKVELCLEYGIQPLFCCGEALAIREAGTENAYVQRQIEESLFQLSDEQVRQVIIAYEPIWAIGTGKTASAQQAQEMHAHIRSVLAGKWGKETADAVPILYGGSVKAGNAAELFASPDVDGGLVGGAALVAQDFVQIIKALKS